MPNPKLHIISVASLLWGCRRLHLCKTLDSLPVWEVQHCGITNLKCVVAPWSKKREERVVKVCTVFHDDVFTHPVSYCTGSQPWAL